VILIVLSPVILGLLLLVLLGNDRIKVLTPKVETRLRRGQFAQIPLKLEVMLDTTLQISLIVEISRGYPRTPIGIEVFHRFLRSDKDADDMYNVIKTYVSRLSESVINYYTADLRKSESEGRLPIGICDIISFGRSDIARNPPGIIIASTSGISNYSDYHAIIDLNDKESELDNELGNINDGLDYLTPAVQSGTNDQETYQYLTCKSCRERLFLASELETHSTSHKFISSRTSKKCTSLFLENPPVWLNVQTELSGKLNCTKCSAKIGQWSWNGSPCSCGEWIVPAFQINISKVDLKS
jgi:hypothetical protein